MFERIVVPLDGSQLAEAVLPVVVSLGKKLSAHIVLLHTLEREAPSKVHGEKHLTNEEQAYQYLAEVEERFFQGYSQVESHVHTQEVEDVADSIVEHIDEFDPGMIAMCTHGRSGLRTRLFGSIAQKVVTAGRTPVLLVDPSKFNPAATYQCEHLLVPLDGDADHEGGLPAAQALATACHASLDMLMVVPTVETLSGEPAATAILLPGATREVLDMSLENAQEYLQQKLDGLQAEGIQTGAKILRGDAAAKIVTACEDLGANLIVLATHGKQSAQAFWEGSVSPKVITQSSVPVLLVPVEGREVRDSEEG
jgi:nucleotide-binding universal stress UspA family protein